MLKRGYKLIISVVLVATLFIGSSIFASADFAGGAGLLSSALSSLGVDLLAGGGATAATLVPWLNGGYSIRGMLTGVADGFIKVTENSVFIDGVEYQNIFLDPSMASELHIQAFDFITNKAIIDNDSGILASGTGFVDGASIFHVSNGYVSQTVVVDSNAGDYMISDSAGMRVVISPSSDEYRRFTPFYDSTFGTTQSVRASNFPYDARWHIINSQGVLQYKRSSASSWSNTSLVAPYVESPFTYSYVSGTIDVDPLPIDYGFSAYIPKSDLVAGNVVAGTYYNNDTAGLEIVNKLIDLLDNAYGNEQIKEAEFSEEVQPVPPVPDTTIADTAYADLHLEMVDIKNNQAHANSALDNIDSNIDVIGRTVDHLDETVTDIEGYIQTGTTDIVDAVDTAGQIIDGKLDDIEGAIDTYGQSVVTEIGNVETAVDTAGQSVVDSVDAQTQALEESISDVADKVESLDTTVDEVIEKIESHPLDLFGAFLDRLTEIPVIKDLFDGIKQHVGIWHYVVEWLQCIGTFLTFFIGLFADVAYCMVVPIYACVAGAICLAFYKRFGR